jgi:uncharacterized glyoxalase superfamily protein PhnB
MLSRPTFSPTVVYRDEVAAMRWLETAFGFEPNVVVTDNSGKIVHAELKFQDGVLGVAASFMGGATSPADLDGRFTQSTHVQLRDGIDAHYEQARRAGAEIIREIADQTYGDRSYMARDLEGHVWSFGQTLQAMTTEEWDKASNTTTRERI